MFGLTERPFDVKSGDRSLCDYLMRVLRRVFHETRLTVLFPSAMLDEQPMTLHFPRLLTTEDGEVVTDADGDPIIDRYEKAVAFPVVVLERAMVKRFVADLLPHGMPPPISAKFFIQFPLKHYNDWPRSYERLWPSLLSLMHDMGEALLKAGEIREPLCLPPKPSAEELEALATGEEMWRLGLPDDEEDDDDDDEQDEPVLAI